MFKNGVYIYIQPAIKMAMSNQSYILILYQWHRRIINRIRLTSESNNYHFLIQSTSPRWYKPTHTIRFVDIFYGPSDVVRMDCLMIGSSIECKDFFTSTKLSMTHHELTTNHFFTMTLSTASYAISTNSVVDPKSLLRACWFHDDQFAFWLDLCPVTMLLYAHGDLLLHIHRTISQPKCHDQSAIQIEIHIVSRSSRRFMRLILRISCMCHTQESNPSCRDERPSRWPLDHHAVYNYLCSALLFLF